MARAGESDLNLSIGAAVIIDGVHDIPPIFDKIGDNDSRTPYGVCFGWSISILHERTMAQLPGIANYFCKEGSGRFKLRCCKLSRITLRIVINDVDKGSKQWLEL